MCCRLAFDPDDYFPARFGLGKITKIPARYNIAPQQQVFVIINDGKENKLETMRWGLIPFWANDEKIGYKTVNARMESIADKPSFRNAFIRRRCIIPASGFYEWQQAEKSKIPYFIHRKDNDYLSLAGLYESWKDPQGKLLQTFTIITLSANTQMQPVHERMPAILNSSSEKIWLNPEGANKDELLRVLQDAANTDLDMYPVSTKVNNTKIDSPDLIEKSAI